MKNLLLLAVFVLGMNTVFAQESITIDLDVKPIKTEQQVIGKAEPTIHVAIYKKTKHIIYKSTTKQGKTTHFIVYKNSKGGYSKKYITEEQFGNILS